MKLEVVSIRHLNMHHLSLIMCMLSIIRQMGLKWLLFLTTSPDI
jgi:hypothetical protein